MKKYLACLGFLLMTGTALSKETDTYLCITDYATGFSFDVNKKAWLPTNFTVKDLRYTLSNKDGKWKWKKFGKQYEYSCNEFNEYGAIFCALNGFEEIMFSSKTMRFRAVYLAGYVYGEDNDTDTPGIQIGTCAKL